MPTLCCISIVDRQQAYLAQLVTVLVSRPSQSARRDLRRLDKIKEESDSTTDSYENRDAQQRVSHLTEVDGEFIVDNPHLKHRDSLMLCQEGNDGNFFARCRESFVVNYLDSRLNNALRAYRMGQRSSLSLTQIEISSDFNVDQYSMSVFTDILSRNNLFWRNF